MQHEAGHFLIAYLVGILPSGYTLSSLEAFKKEGSLNVQAGTAFVDFEFLEEVMLLSSIYQFSVHLLSFGVRSVVFLFVSSSLPSVGNA